MAKYLDSTGLQSLWKKIKSLVSGVSDDVTTIKNNYITKVWFNSITASTSFKTKLTNYLSPKTVADSNNGVSNAEIGIFAALPIILTYDSKSTMAGDEVEQTMAIAIQKATSTQDGYMTKEDKATIDGLGALATKDTLASTDLSDASDLAHLESDNVFTGENTFYDGTTKFTGSAQFNGDIGFTVGGITMTRNGIEATIELNSPTQTLSVWNTEGSNTLLGSLALKSGLAFADLTDKPTTLSGYGITNGVTSITNSGTGNAITSLTVLNHTLQVTKGSTFLTTTAASSTYLTKTTASSTYLPLAGGTLTGELKTTSNISANKGFILQVDGLSVLTLNSSGNLAIGYGYRSTSATSLQGKTVELKSGDTTILNVSSTGVAVTGKVTATGSISGNSSSDERKKENIVEADSLAELSTLGGVYDFDYKETGEHSTGFIAQKVQDGMFADIVTEDEDGYKQINYWSPKLIAAAIGAIGQLEARVKDLEAMVKELESK